MRGEILLLYMKYQEEYDAQLGNHLNESLSKNLNDLRYMIDDKSHYEAYRLLALIEFRAAVLQKSVDHLAHIVRSASINMGVKDSPEMQVESIKEHHLVMGQFHYGMSISKDDPLITWNDEEIGIPRTRQKQ